MMVESSEMNVSAAMGWVMSGMSKVYSSPVAVKFFNMFSEFLMKSEAEKAGWKLVAGAGFNGAAWAMGAS